MKRILIFNYWVDALTAKEMAKAAVDLIANGQRGWISNFNANVILQAGSNPRLAAYIKAAALVFADGQPIVWCARLFGGRLPERVAGIDFIPHLCSAAQDQGLGVYLLGGSDEVITDVAKRLSKEFPRLRLEHANGYFLPEDVPARVEAIKNSGCQILIVAMGIPLQEQFIADNWEHLGAAIAMGVGGSFDVMTGKINRAPKALQNAGLEWLYRLIQEPRRLFVRTLSMNINLIWLTIKFMFKKPYSDYRS
jgi:N-acetylglucosaminyldiphosphoundecaprenol N-acetyl-beta-D-mannosaminyltransferase